MKNKFLVINKEKIYAYVVSIMTIVTIFCMTNMMNHNFKDTEEVLSNDVQNASNEIVTYIESQNTTDTSSEIGDETYETESNLIEEIE